MFAPLTMLASNAHRHTALRAAMLLVGFGTSGLISNACSYDVRLTRTGASAAGGTFAHAGGAGGATGATGTQPLSPLPAKLSWQWQISGNVDTTVDAKAFVVDLFDVEPGVLAQLKSLNRTVICSFSAGTYEPWRADAAQLPARVRGNAVAGAPKESWLDVRSAEVRALMVTRLELAVTRGCSGVLPDAVDGYAADNGFALGIPDTLDYLNFLSAQGRQRGLHVGLASAAELASKAEPLLDFVAESRCIEFKECAAYQSFATAGKPVLHAELVASIAEGSASLAALCADPTRQGFSTIVKRSELDAWRLSCD